MEFQAPRDSPATRRARRQLLVRRNARDELSIVVYFGELGMEEITQLDKFTASPFRQEISLQRVDHEAGFTTLRVRIRELKRFTVFDIDEHTAEHWGRAMLEWAETQRQGAAK